MFDLHQLFRWLLFLSNKSETEELLGAAVFSTVVLCSLSLAADLFVPNSSPVHGLEGHSYHLTTAAFVLPGHCHVGMCWNPSTGTCECDLVCYLVFATVKLRSLGWALIQYDWMVCKTDESRGETTRRHMEDAL